MTDVVKLFYESHGSGPALVLLHGYPLDHTIWDAVVPELAQRCRVIAPDMRGHGRSPAPEGVYEMRLLAADIAALLDELGLDQAVLAGHSMGGYAALAFAQAYPGRVRGLALVASQAAADPPERRQARYETAAQIAAQGMAAVAGEIAPRLAVDPALVEPLRRLILRANPTGSIGILKGMAARPNLTEFIAGLDLPVLVVAGEQDAFIPVESSRGLAARLRRGRLVVIPGAGHLPMMEAPHPVAEALLTLI